MYFRPMKIENEMVVQSKHLIEIKMPLQCLFSHCIGERNILQIVSCDFSSLYFLNTLQSDNN